MLANGNGEVAKRFSPKQVAIRDAVGLDKLWAAINMRALSLPFSFSLSLSPFPLSLSLHSKKNQVPGNLSSVKRQARASTRRVHGGERSGACGHGEGKGEGVTEYAATSQQQLLHLLQRHHLNAQTQRLAYEDPFRAGSSRAGPMMMMMGNGDGGGTQTQIQHRCT